MVSGAQDGVLQQDVVHHPAVAGRPLHSRLCPAVSWSGRHQAYDDDALADLGKLNE